MSDDDKEIISGVEQSNDNNEKAIFIANQNEMIEKWRSELDKMSTEVLVLFHNRDIYNRFFDIIENNPRIQKGNAFYEWMNLHYVVYAATAIRRLLDKDKRTVSLHNLINEIDANKRYITREWYISQYSSEVFSESSLPSNIFNGLAGDDPNIIDSQQLIYELDEVESVSRIVKIYVDKLIAHADRVRPDRLPEYNEIDKAIDAVGNLFQLLYFILNATYISLEIQEEYDWTQLFKEPWIVP